MKALSKNMIKNDLSLFLPYWDTIWDVVEQASTHWLEHLQAW
jgi:hypothetical protein